MAFHSLSEGYHGRGNADGYAPSDNCRQPKNTLVKYHKKTVEIVPFAKGPLKRSDDWLRQKRVSGVPASTCRCKSEDTAGGGNEIHLRSQGRITDEYLPSY